MTAILLMSRSCTGHFTSLLNCLKADLNKDDDYSNSNLNLDPSSYEYQFRKAHCDTQEPACKYFYNHQLRYTLLSRLQ
jgi:hypothetical protein